MLLLRASPFNVQPLIKMIDYKNLFVNKLNPVILDIGANDGLDSVSISKIFPNSIIHCFEPDPRAIKRFSEFSSIYKNIHLHQIAIGGVNGTVLFHQSDGFPEDYEASQMRPEGWDLSGSIKTPTGHLEANPGAHLKKSIDVKCMTLDSWLAEKQTINSIELMRLDTQGAEGDILKNCPIALSLTNYIFTEYSDIELYEGQVSLMELDKILVNFEIMQVFENDVLFRNKSFKSSPKTITTLG